MMKMHFKAAAGAAAILVALAAGNANAESSYGASSDGTGVSATATVRINVTTPKLILLRVGNPNTQTVLDFDLQANMLTSPTPIAVMGNNQAANWNGAAPTFALTTPVGAVAAYLWHNATGTASLSCTATTTFTTGLADTDVLVASSGAAGFDLNHPGTDTACGTAVTGLARNTVHNGSWTYSLKPSVLTTATPGSDFEVVTYTATAL